MVVGEGAERKEEIVENEGMEEGEEQDEALAGSVREGTEMWPWEDEAVFSEMDTADDDMDDQDDPDMDADEDATSWQSNAAHRLAAEVFLDV